MIAVKVREEMLPSGEISSCITGTGSGIEATSKGDSFFSTTGTWATRTSKKFKKTQNNYNKRSFSGQTCKRHKHEDMEDKCRMVPAGTRPSSADGATDGNFCSSAGKSFENNIK